MDYYSEVEGEVFQSAPQACGSLAYTYVFTVETDPDKDPETVFIVDLWYNLGGFLMSPQFEALTKVHQTEEDARNVKAQVEAWVLQNAMRLLKCD
jgi:hypothetical protein